MYCLIRTQTLLFPETEPSVLILVLAGLTMVVGVLGAIAQNDMKRILSFHIVSQIGYMLLGLGLFTVAGLAGAVLFLVHQIPVKTSLFLTSGLVEEGAGSTALNRVGGLLRRAPLTAALFGLAALSLAGIPPFSGFVGKLSLIEAGFGAEEYAIAGVALLVSLFTLFSMAKIWNGVFWGTAEDPTLRMGDGVHAAPQPATHERGDDRPGRAHPGHRGVRRSDLRAVRACRRGPARPHGLRQRGAGPMSSASVLRRVLNSLVLLAVWVALWGEPSVGNVLSGVAAILVINLVFPTGPDVVAAEDEGAARLFAALRFLVIFAWALIVANVQVVVAVLRPRLRIAEGVVAVPLVSRSPIIATMVANAISLTPGTLTVEIGGGGAGRPGGAAGRATPGADVGDEPPVVLYVHALTLDDADAVRADGRRFEGLAVAAFGSATDRARLKAAAS